MTTTEAGQQGFSDKSENRIHKNNNNNTYILVSACISSDLFCEVGNDKRSLYIKSESPIHVYSNKSGNGLLEWPCKE